MESNSLSQQQPKFSKFWDTIDNIDRYLYWIVYEKCIEQTTKNKTA